MAKYEAGFIGAGNMGGALALAAAKKTGGDRIAVACSTRERSEAAAQRLGCTAETPQRILSDSRFVFLGVKPQMVVGVVESLKADILASEGIFVSMLAGVSLEKLALLLGADKKIIRIMPNTPCAVGQGLILYAANGRVSEDELCAFRELMAPAGAALKISPVGRLVWVTSSTMPTVKWFFGASSLRLSNTALTWVGVNSLEPRP